jgi:hypothetical protein
VTEKDDRPKVVFVHGRRPTPPEPDPKEIVDRLMAPERPALIGRRETHDGKARG